MTSIPLTSAKQARKCLKWYRRPWRIEEWHRVLKSGCKILDHQNQTAPALLRILALDAVIAWHITLLSLLGREPPDLPAELFFDAWECERLEVLAHPERPVKNSASAEPQKSSLAWAATRTARLRMPVAGRHHF